VNEVSVVHPALEVRQSPISGLGLFATEPIAAGSVCVEMGGRVIDATELARIAATGKPYSAFALDAGTHVLQAADDPARFGNHSCDPNLELAGPTTLVARRAIAAGEEVTVDYATMSESPSWSMPCNCGSPNCRRVIVSAGGTRPGVAHPEF
jgi:SET domain-containing protein